MPLPLLLIAAPILMGGLLGGAQYYGQKKQADQLDDAAQAEYENAKIQAANLMAEKERVALEREAQETNARNQMARRRSSQRAAYAKSGVLTQGTPETFLVDQARVDELNLQEGRRRTKYDMALYDWRRDNTLIAGENRAKTYQAQADGIMKKAKFDFAKTMVMSAAGGIAGAGGLGAIMGGGGAGGLMGGAASSAAPAAAGSAAQSGSMAQSVFGSGGTFGSFISNPQYQSSMLGSFNGAFNSSKSPWE